MMFATRGAMVSLANRKLSISGGEPDLDYKIDGNKNGVFLFTADKENLVKGKSQSLTLITRVRPLGLFNLAVKVNAELYRHCKVSAPVWVDSDDTGEIILNITPRVDIDLCSLDYIVKLLIEGV